MTVLTNFLSLPLAERLGWALVHFLWQGALAAGVLLVMQRLLLRASAEMRYAAACLTLALMAASPLATFLCLPGPESEERASGRVQPCPAMTPAAGISMCESPRSSVVGVPPAIAPSAALSPHDATSAAAPTASEPSRSWRLAISHRLRSCIPWVTAAWLVGVLFLSLRLLASWRSVQRMRRAGTSGVGEHLAILLREISEQLGVRRVVQLLESTVAEVPAAVGWFRPVILLPVSAVTGLSETQLKAILAHELAHIRRHDYLVNLAQSIVETLLFYHPAVWWASARIRQEREHCCDDLAGAVCGNRIDYARALLRMEELRGPSGNFVLAASGGRLTLRIRRLLGVPHRDRGDGWWLGGAMTFLVVTAIVIGLWWTSALAASPSTAASSEVNPARNEKVSNTDDLAESDVARHEEGEATVKLKRAASEVKQAPAAKSQEAPAEALLTVNVYDEPTNEPMKRFQVVPGFAEGGYGPDPIDGPGEADEKTPAVWQPQRMRQCTDGLFTWPATRPGKELRFRIEADGYIPVLTAWIKKSDGKQTLNIAMRRDPGLTGKVLTPNGTPAAGATLAVTMRNRPARIENGEFVGLDDPPPATANERWKRPIFATADADGRYRLGTQVGAVIVYAVHDSGIAELPFNALQKSPDIRLQAWASIEGRVLWVDNPGANEDLAFSAVRTFAGVFRSLEWKMFVKTDDQGRFRAARLPPWSATLSRRFKLPNDWGDYLYPTLPVELKPGESTDVVFGGRGRPAVGKLVGFSSWEGTTVELYPRLFGGYEQFGRTMVSQSNFGPLLFRTGIPVAEDGTFRIENVLPAHYTLLVNNRERGFYAWHKDSHLTIDPMPGGESDEPFDMGEVRVKQHGTGKPADPLSSASMPQR